MDGEHVTNCSELRMSGRFLNNSLWCVLTLRDSISSLVLILHENRLELTENSLKTSGSACTH